MKQKLFTPLLILGCLLLLLLAAAGCGAAPDASGTPEPTAASGSSSAASAPSSGAASVASEAEADYAAQLRLIAANAAVWMGDTELTAEPYFYAVTDLDQNGRLEIIQSSRQGTGLYTYTNIWEVSADGTELAPCQYSVAEVESQPDIITDPLAVYFDAANGRYFYIFTDDIRNGAAEYYQSLMAFSLREGVVSVSLLCQSHSVYSSASSVETTYADAEGNAIGEDAYNSAADEAFAGMTAMSAAIGWTDYSVSERLAQLSAEEITAILESSWEGFALGR